MVFYEVIGIAVVMGLIFIGGRTLLMYLDRREDELLQRTREAECKTQEKK